MKKITLTLLASIFALASFAQKYAYVDTDYILKNIPEYIAAQKTIDDLSEKYQKELEAKKAMINKKYQLYQAEELLLPSEMKKKKQDEIFALEDDLVKFQQEKFGVEGEIFQKRKELVEPIQNKVYAAIKELASVGNYDFIFDKAGSSNILYADPKNDKSKRILKNLGY
ncbi:OmpH family outer membrane protein [Flavobacteriales bacterium]|jgi:outer membrane protein|nr:OmpH family outer membrane protein [Flavobacteriales bacterium]MDC0015021.1 OmpH family outer membrane protein [Flavobacteriales bacterium]|tara:strand:- start:4554 stop:5060 length:507 start_codon:yes stop_codon:yes gene_type:complete